MSSPQNSGAYRSHNEIAVDEDSSSGSDKEGSNNKTNERQTEVDRSSTQSNYDSDEDQTDKGAEADDVIDQIAKEVGKVTLGDDSKKEDGAISEDDEADQIHHYEDTPGLPTLARWIQTGEVSNILVLSGAGVSCSAGIPDFRTPGTGLYSNLAKYNLPYPEAVFDIKFYRRNTQPFVALASELWPGLRHSPTLTHSFVKLLDDKGLLLRNYTQNIDGLEQLAGVCEEKIVECHGHFRTASCANCFSRYDGNKAKEEIVRNQRAPKCRACKGPVKPDIVFCKCCCGGRSFNVMRFGLWIFIVFFGLSIHSWFELPHNIITVGEGLPDRFGRLLRQDLEVADLIIVMGTSLTVAPVSLIPTMVHDDCRRVLFNRELVGDFNPGQGQQRDIFGEGDIDDTVHELCELLGWEQELHVQTKKTRIRKGSG